MRQLIFGLVSFVTGWLLGAQRGASAPRDASAQRDASAPQAQTLASPAAMQLDQEFDARVERAAELAAQVEHVAELVAPLEPLVAELSVASTSAIALRESVAALDKQLGRVGREQFKVNTLSETQQQNIQTALDQLRDLNTRRESDVALLRDQLRADQSAQRLLVIQRILPALDGLDEAIASGERLRARQPRSELPIPPRLTLPQRLALAVGRGEIPLIQTDGAEELRHALAAWLAGIELVRDRLLQALATEGVYPIPARDELFDPHRHIAVAAIPATDAQPAGTITDEYRRGYQVGARTAAAGEAWHVLRAAEVVVARSDAASENSKEDSQ